MSTDINLIASRIVNEATGTEPERRHPAAVASGRLGGLKGGNARAKTLTPEQRSAIAKKAAKKRWGTAL